MNAQEAEFIIRDCRSLIDQAQTVFTLQQSTLTELRRLIERTEHLSQMVQRFAVGEKP